MSNPGYHAADDGSLARSTGGAAARGAMLIALALIIGLLLMAFALDDPQTDLSTAAAGDDVEQSDDDGEGGAVDGDDTNAADSESLGSEEPAVQLGVPDESADTTPPAAEEETTETIPPVTEGTEARPASEVTVLVANGTGGRGVAGAVSDKLKARSYIANVSNAPSTAEAIIYYRVGFAADARAVAEVLGSPPDIITQAPGDGTIAVSADAVSDGRLTGANVVVIIGNDGNVPTS